jgi:hypothetical protein
MRAPEAHHDHLPGLVDLPGDHSGAAELVQRGAAAGGLEQCLGLPVGQPGPDARGVDVAGRVAFR